MSETWSTAAHTGPIRGTATPPGSKSLTNRALVLSTLAAGMCELRGVLFADDTRHMLDNLQQLGLDLNINEAAKTVKVDASSSPDFATEDATLYCGNSGTTLRFLSGLLAAVGEGTFTLDGNGRMRERPIDPLVTLLNDLAGSDIASTVGPCPPVTLEPALGLAGGDLTYAAGRTLSSQYLSAALMVAPYAREEVRFDLDGVQVSWPYVRMTMRLMDIFGVTPEVEQDDQDRPQAIIIPQGRYGGTHYDIEPDASAASYFFGLAAVHPGSEMTIRHLGRDSIQGDTKVVEVLSRFGCEVRQKADVTTVIGPSQLQGVDVDMGDMPDCAQTIAVVALFASGPTTLRGLRTLRVKETDRVEALRAELTKLGADVTVEEGDDLSLTIVPPPRVRKARIATYDDHRMAMSFALAATKRNGIEIENPQCVNKTYPDFFDDLSHLLTANESERA
jgi:3-phosphoshikimate 1-carboxyvinyltransferase